MATSNKGLFLSQRKYVFDLLKEIDKLEAKSANTSMEINVKIELEDGEPLLVIGQFQRLVGKLIYLFVIRFDILSIVSVIS
jgi:hypothetical protein